jgi:hypothetical protein
LSALFAISRLGHSGNLTAWKTWRRTGFLGLFHDFLLLLDSCPKIGYTLGRIAIFGSQGKTKKETKMVMEQV